MHISVAFPAVLLVAFRVSLLAAAAAVEFIALDGCASLPNYRVALDPVNENSMSKVELAAQQLGCQTNSHNGYVAGFHTAPRWIFEEVDATCDGVALKFYNINDRGDAHHVQLWAAECDAQCQGLVGKIVAAMNPAVVETPRPVAVASPAPAPDPRAMTLAPGSLRDEGGSCWSRIVPSSTQFPVVSSWDDYAYMLTFAQNANVANLNLEQAFAQECNGVFCLGRIPGFAEERARVAGMDKFTRAAERPAIVAKLNDIEQKLRDELKIFSATAFRLVKPITVDEAAYNTDNQHLGINLTNPGWPTGPGYRVNVALPLEAAHRFFARGKRSGSVMFAAQPYPDCRGKTMQVVSAAWVAFDGPDGFGFLVPSWHKLGFPPGVTGDDSMSTSIDSVEALSPASASPLPARDSTAPGSKLAVAESAAAAVASAPAPASGGPGPATLATATMLVDNKSNADVRFAFAVGGNQVKGSFVALKQTTTRFALPAGKVNWSYTSKTGVSASSDIALRAGGSATIRCEPWFNPRCGRADGFGSPAFCAEDFQCDVAP